MDDQKFKFIELPHPEIELSPDGSALLLGGIYCRDNYQFCASEKKSTCDLGDDLKGYNFSGNCSGESAGCGSGIYCNQYDCTEYVCSKYNCSQYANLP